MLVFGVGALSNLLVLLLAYHCRGHPAVDDAVSGSAFAPSQYRSSARGTSGAASQLRSRYCFSAEHPFSSTTLTVNFAPSAPADAGTVPLINSLFPSRGSQRSRILGRSGCSKVGHCRIHRGHNGAIHRVEWLEKKSH